MARGENLKQGFTVVELLTVIAIITALAAIIVPSLHHSKSAANTIHCVNNLRQLGIALSLYRSEFERYPAAMSERIDNIYAWPARLLPYAGHEIRVFSCPANRPEFHWRTNSLGGHRVFPLNVDLLTGFSYGYNAGGVFYGYGLGLGHLPGSGPDGEVPESKVLRPSGMIAMADSTSDFIADALIYYPPRPRKLSPVIPASRHRGGANILFCDSRVERWRQSQATSWTDAVASQWNNDNLPHRELWDPHNP